MAKRLTESELRELERQLAYPSGKTGIQLAHQMNASNWNMTLTTLHLLGVEKGNTVLELGHGNCGHLEKLLELAEGIDYVGLEVSETMWEEACKLHKDKPAHFQLYNGTELPFTNAFFDRIFSVNTIYFWSKPEMLLQEIERTLKPGGSCVLTYANKIFMKQLDFVGSAFRLFDIADVESLIAPLKLAIVEVREKEEQVMSKSGVEVIRPYTLIKLQHKV
jgi:SAM-dependent methyltransferase